MSKITGSFLTLVFVIVFSSIVYIWQADAEKKTMEGQIASHLEQINDLETQLKEQSTASNQITAGEVAGINTVTGQLSGTITLSKENNAEAVVVCSIEIRTKQETCTDIILEENINTYDFELDIPQGKYEVYAMVPPLETKVYYSDISTCDENGDCTSNSLSKRLIEVNQDETQSNINIYL